MDFKDSIAAVGAAAYWLQTVLEDRAESAPPPSVKFDYPVLVSRIVRTVRLAPAPGLEDER